MGNIVGARLSKTHWQQQKLRLLLGSRSTSAAAMPMPTLGFIFSSMRITSPLTHGQTTHQTSYTLRMAKVGTRAMGCEGREELPGMKQGNNYKDVKNIPNNGTFHGSNIEHAPFFLKSLCIGAVHQLRS
eukprot:2341378-Amphidinium_carterae.1